jgi:hypothetical protein
MASLCPTWEPGSGGVDGFRLEFDRIVDASGGTYRL